MDTLPTPFYFGQPACFGWLQGLGGTGLPVLICGPVGAEDLSAHRLLRLAAQRLADGGQPCLRFDWPGVGDAAALAPEANAVPAWLEAVAAAIEALRAATGAPRVAVLGLRLGATLAAQAVAGRRDVAAFAAWVPVVNGRHLVREWKMLGSAGLPALVHEDGSIETGGFHVNAATCKGVAALNLVQPLVRPAGRLLVIDRDDLPAAQPWCDALQAGADGAAPDVRRLGGFEGLMAVPHLVRLPEAMLDEAVRWLQWLPRPVATLVVPAGQPRLPTSTLHASEGLPVREGPVWLHGGSTDEPPLLGLLAEPAVALAEGAAPVHPRRAVLVLNTGAERRIGPHGQFVAAARRWAAAGAVVLRLDLAGLGDSPARRGEPEQRVYPPAALADVARAVAHLRSRPDVGEVVLLGLCSGAFHAFEALAAGLAVDRAVALNPLLFFRPEREDFDQPAPHADHAVQQLSGEAWRKLRDPARWRKLLRGRADLGFLAGLVLRRAALAVQRLAARLPGRQTALASKLQRAAGRAAAGDGVARLTLVFAENDPGLSLLQGEAGPVLQRLQREGRVRVHLVPGADHTFSRSAMRQRLQAALDEALGLPAPAAPRPEAARTA